MSEKKQNFTGLPTTVQVSNLDRPRGRKRAKALMFGLCLSALAAGGFVLRTAAPSFIVLEPSVQATSALCPQVKPITPIKHSAIWESLIEKSATDEHKARTIEWLSGAVRIRYALWSSLALNWILTTCPEPSRMITWNPWAWIPVGMLLGRSTIIC